MRQIADPTRYGKYAVTVQTILRFPDHHLRATAQRVVVFDEDLCSLATNLLDTLRAASAIGITATHIGVLKRLAVIEIAAAEGVRTYVNPQIVWASADMIRYEEGSISMPGVTEDRTPCPCADALPGYERCGKGRRGRWSALRMSPARGRSA
jgi:hypothetical protein